MSAVTDREGRNVPFFYDYHFQKNISTAAYSPLEDPSEDEGFLGVVKDKGFLVKPDVDGDAFYCITHYEYKNNGYKFDGLVPQPCMVKEKTFLDTRVVKVYAKNHAIYPNTAFTKVDIGIIL